MSAAITFEPRNFHTNTSIYENEVFDARASHTGKLANVSGQSEYTNQHRV
ncbi:hypothetical protein MO867_02700 [Microbulbifer sp. OS29]|uniref:Uncharacterized protein n=1 Tax=Microbulbifer okhotskensis TaxID=2926617 RepID=A0A9X2J695_9GAMM|nr:hypothetical protein [Microbulbifer okhotskensis]MCO1333241.1 hypothetical protein [Microbulbifer okhotskensis]